MQMAGTQTFSWAPGSDYLIFDVTQRQVKEEAFSMLAENNILIVKVPASCTDHLQPMDLSINKAVKEFMRSKFSKLTCWLGLEAVGWRHQITNSSEPQNVHHEAAWGSLAC